MNVLVIPEDFRKDQYMLKPIVRAMLSYLGKPRANVVVCKDPLLGGVTEATKWENLQDILERYGGVDLYLLCVDRDGREGRRTALDNLEQLALGILKPEKLFLAENAWQEIEVWVLAGHDLPKDWKWADIRADAHPKEAYFLPFAELREVQDTEAEGRRILAEQAAPCYVKRIRKLCSEDVLNLETRIQQWLGAFPKG